MKMFFCVILLLAFSATQVRGNCIFGHERVTTGYHTIRPCLRMHCDERGIITMYRCPVFICPPSKKVLFLRDEEDTRPFPDCCRQPICQDLEPALPVYEEY